MTSLRKLSIRFNKSVFTASFIFVASVISFSSVNALAETLPRSDVHVENPTGEDVVSLSYAFAIGLIDKMLVSAIERDDKRQMEELQRIRMDIVDNAQRNASGSKGADRDEMGHDIAL